MDGPVYLYDYMKEVVEAMKLKQKCFYQFGHPMEILENLTEMSSADSTKKLKYPIIAVLSDVEVKRDSANYYGKVNLTVLIATKTDKALKADAREKTNFKPILLPLYYDFLEHLIKCGHFKINYDGNIPHNYIKRMYWGKNGIFITDSTLPAPFNDFIDGIEINNLQLTIKNPTNEKTT